MCEQSTVNANLGNLTAQCIDHTLILLTVSIRLRTAQALPSVSNFINSSHEVYNYFRVNTCIVPIMHLPSTGDDVFTAPCVELTCEELGAVSPSVTGIV